MSINRVNISGNLTRDPELRQTTSGTAILRFGVAVNDRRRNQSGEWEDVPNFVDCVVFGNRAEPLSRPPPRPRVQSHRPRRPRIRPPRPHRPAPSSRPATSPGSTAPARPGSPPWTA